MITEESVSNIIKKLSVRYYGEECLILKSIKNEDPILINIGFMESFIPRMAEAKFHDFKKELNNNISKLVPKKPNSCRVVKSSCSSCGGCSSTVDVYYRIQFSEYNG